MSDTTEVTRLLHEIGHGDQEALNQLLPLVYEELHRLASSYFRRERMDHTLQPTALVNEAYMRLTREQGAVESRGHFLAMAATQMRRILVDHARKHRAARRGLGGEKVMIEDHMAICGPRPVDMIALDSALDRLATLDAPQAHLVELRFFGGLSVEETAELMGISTATVKRSWSSARAFLRREIKGHGAAQTAEAGEL